MLYLPDQKILPFLRALLLGDVPRNFRCADDLAVAIPDRRYSQRDINQTSILALPYRLVVVDAFTATYTSQNFLFFVMTILRDQHDHRPVDRFIRRITEKPLCAAIPTG